MVPAKSYRQDLPLGEGAPACRGGRGRRDAAINFEIPGEMVRCTDSPQNVRGITACCGPLQSCFARQLPPREAFGGYITFWHSTYPVPYPTWVGRMISSPTVRELSFYHSTHLVCHRTWGGRLIASPTGGAQCFCFHRKNVTGWGRGWIGISPKGGIKNPWLKKPRVLLLIFGISP